MQKQSKRLIGGAVAAVPGLLGLLCTFGLNARKEQLWELLALPLAAGLFFLLGWLAWPRITRRKLKYALPLGVFFGLCNALGADFFLDDQLDPSPEGFLLKLGAVLGLGFVYGAVAVLILSVPPMKQESRISGPRMFWLAWGVLLLCWLPCYIAFFPGIFAYDIPTQLRGISEGYLTTDHPILHTLIAWGCFSLGNKISSYTLGAALYSLVQTLALSAAYSAVVAFLRRPALRWGSLAWFALLPIHPLFAVNATKDVLFAACTILFLLPVLLLLRCSEYLKKPWFWAWFLGAAVAMALMRNTGIYVFIVFVPGLLLLLPRRRWMALGLCLLCIGGFFGSRSALNSAVGVQEGRFTETLSVPLQQIARCAQQGVLTDEELAQVEKYIPEGIWQTYHSRLADYIKNEIDRETIQQDPAGLIRLWVRLGLRYPGQYIEAFMGMNVGYWYPDAEYPDPGMWHDYIEARIKNLGPVLTPEDPELWPACREFYQQIAAGAAEKLPAVDLLLKPGIYCWATVCLLALALYRRNRSAGGVLVFLLLSWLLQLLSPIALLRYVYPMMAALPLAAGSLEDTKDEKSVADHSGL